MYGCTYDDYDHDSLAKNATLRFLPVMMAQLNPDFDFKFCSFAIQKCKETTGRVVSFRQLGIRNSFTLECSFYGRGGVDDLQMNMLDYANVGRDLARCIQNFIP